MEQNPSEPTKVDESLHVCESDGLVYTSMPPQYKCKICGRFSFDFNFNQSK